MAEYIGCRKCDSPDCKGCNLKNLETMLNNGKFDCLMNGNRCINPSADVAPVRHGRWDENGRCTVCGGHAPFWSMASTYYESPYCFECGANMDLEVS